MMGGGKPREKAEQIGKIRGDSVRSPRNHRRDAVDISALIIPSTKFLSIARIIANPEFRGCHAWGRTLKVAHRVGMIKEEYREEGKQVLRDANLEAVHACQSRGPGTCGPRSLDFIRSGRRAAKPIGNTQMYRQ